MITHRLRVACVHLQLVPPPSSEKASNTRYLNATLAALEQDTLIMFGGGLGNDTHRTDHLNPEQDAAYSFGA